MPTLQVKNTRGDSVGEVELADDIFADEVHEHLLWEVVKWQRARWRAGTHHTKRRGEVRTDMDALTLLELIEGPMFMRSIMRPDQIAAFDIESHVEGVLRVVGPRD